MMPNINQKKLPTSIGPYSPYRRKENLLFTSGQLPINPETNKIETTDVYNQASQCLENIKSIIYNEGFRWENVMKLTVFMTDLSNFSEVNRVFDEKLKEPFPARTAIEISQLPMGSLVEIEAILVKDSGMDQSQ